MHDYLISITFTDPSTNEVKHYCMPVRHQDISEHCAKIRASKRAKRFELIAKSDWTRHSQSSLTKTYHSETGESRCVIVQRVSKLTR